ncbi:hypothetical protein [Streptomyces sp. NPDC018947]|uniref:hypothetical protein n=1 Tax=Streptomyces sp. NPDC018947 TaxID=3365054 RepID=UPI00379DF312
MSDQQPVPAPDPENVPAMPPASGPYGDDRGAFPPVPPVPPDSRAGCPDPVGRVTLHKGEYFKTNRCQEWKRVG